MKESAKFGWMTAPLGEVASVINGGTPKSNVGKFWGGDVQWLTPKDMGQMVGREISETPRKITDTGLSCSSARLVPAGSVILSTRAPIGHLAINTAPMAFNQGCRGIIPSEKLDPVYLFYFFDMSREALNDLGTGTTFKELSATNLKSLEVPLPPLDEQKRLVAILDEAFEGLDRAQANAEANLANARELFTASLRSLFSDNREHWPLRNIADVCSEFGRGKSRHRPRNDPRLYGGDMPFVQTGDLSKADHFLREYSQTYSPEGVAQSRVWPKGTVCVAIVGATIGESAILDLDACFPDSVIGMVPNPSKADSEFLDFLLQFVKADLKKAGQGSARDNINLGTFSDRLFPIPDLKAQLEAIERISEIDIECRQLCTDYDSKLKSLSDLRQSLLQKAFAGELT